MRDSTPSEHPFASAYVETKIGMLPSGWDVVSLEELSDPSAPIRYGVVQIGPDTPDGIPIVPIKHINCIDGVVLHRASPEIEAGYAGSRVRGGDVLISVKGTIGAVGVVPKGFEGNIAREIARIRPTSSCDATFLALQLEADDTQRRIDSKVVGTTRLEFSIHAVRDFLVALPPLPEQRAIAALLCTWNTAIQKTEQLIAAKERHYNHELSRLISRGQHPHAHVGTFAEEVSTRNRGGKWRTVALSDIATVWKGQQLNKDAMVADGAYYALNGGIKPSGRTTEWNCEANTITVSEGGNSCGFVSYNRERFWCGGHCYAVTKLAKDVDVHYLFHYLKGKQSRVMALRVGSGLPNIQKSDIEAFPVVLPDLVTQTAIAHYLNALREEIDLLGQSVAALKKQKRGLMQKLLTGQWRLSVQEAATA
jgi:type I restriction enzyme S subunit